MAKKPGSGKMVPLSNALIGGGLVLALMLAIGFGSIERYLFNQGAPTADYPAPASKTEARIQDLDYLERYVRGYDRTFSTKARGEGLQMIRDYKEIAGELTFSEFELAISRVVALGENGHSNVWSGSRSRRHPELPVHIYWFDDGVFIVSANPEYADLLGAEITHIGETPVAEIYDMFRPYYGGEDTGYKAYNLSLLFQNTDFLHALGVIEDPENPDLSVILPNGGTLKVTVASNPPDPDRKSVWSWRWLKPVGHPTEDNASPRYLKSEEGQPLYLQNGEAPFHLKRLPEMDGLYVQFRQNDDAEDYPVGRFVGEIRAALKELSPAVLIIDERHNGGGDFTLTADLMFDLPGLLPEGARIYVITGPETFSAAISSIGFLKHAAGDQLTLVGRPIGDSLMMWGETNEFILPNSAIGITASRGFHDQINGCFDRLKCYWTDFSYQVAVGEMKVDVPAPFRFADYAKGIDAAMDKIREIEGAL